VAQERNKGITSNETAEIKHEIERTRVEMSETIGEIQERLRPEHLIQQAKHTMKEAVTEAVPGKVRNIMHSAGETATYVADQTRYAGRSVADYACSHPLQMAALAGGITWLLLRGRGAGASQRWDTDYNTEYSEYDVDLTTGPDRSLRNTVSEYATSARETAGEYADAARSTARRASARVRDAATTASVRARDTWQRTSTSVDDWVHENPLAAGALAVAVGAAIGLSIPSSQWEDRTMGERRDQAMDAARAKARELKDTVTEKANRAAESVVDELSAPPAGTTIASSTTGSV
jgi:ElaB/YqjD/DUF883 family membrane-anchored ribosome-binding protein